MDHPWSCSLGTLRDRASTAKTGVDPRSSRPRKKARVPTPRTHESGHREKTFSTPGPAAGSELPRLGHGRSSLTPPTSPSPPPHTPPARVGNGVPGWDAVWMEGGADTPTPHPSPEQAQDKGTGAGGLDLKSVWNFG